MFSLNNFFFFTKNWYCIFVTVHFLLNRQHTQTYWLSCTAPHKSVVFRCLLNRWQNTAHKYGFDTCMQPHRKAIQPCVCVCVCKLMCSFLRCELGDLWASFVVAGENDTSPNVVSSHTNQAGMHETCIRYVCVIDWHRGTNPLWRRVCVIQFKSLHLTNAAGPKRTCHTNASQHNCSLRKPYKSI